MSSHTEVELTLPNGVKYQQPIGIFINNEFKTSSDGTLIEVDNPSTAKAIVNVHGATKDDVDEAVNSAKTAFKSWKKVTGTERGQLLRKLVDLLKRDAELISAIESWDSGKPWITNAKGDIDASISTYEYYAGWADKIFGQTIETTGKKFAYTKHEAIGVCGQIIPWNFPFLMAAWKIAPAIAAGNVVVLKLAELTPLSMLYFGKLVVEAGFPPGVINIFTGLGAVAGAAISAHPKIDKIAFTGSTATGQRIMEAASGNLKKITLECGGKSPMIVCADADLEQASKWAHAGIMRNMGQICTAISRVYVHESIYEEFLTQYKLRIQEVSKVGDPFHEGTLQGPQISRGQQEKIQGYIQSGIDDGARLIIGGINNKGNPSPHPNNSIPEGGYYIPPTIFADVTENMKIVREEIFGPVVSVSSFKTEEEAIEKANNSEYGLAASVFTQNVVKAHTIADQLESGQVYINSSNDSDFRVPFGGVKMSGFGRELGEYGIANYTNVKAVHVNLGNNL